MLCEQYHRWEVMFGTHHGGVSYLPGGPFYSRETNDVIKCQDCGRLGQVVNVYDTTGGTWKYKERRDYRHRLRRMYV